MTENTHDRHSRTEMLLGNGTISVLATTRVEIFGIGGVGGYALEALVRCGVGEIDVIDFDTVSESNINRQIIATEQTVGRYKVDVCRERALSINSNVRINAIRSFFSPDNADEFDLTKYDYVIDAIDTVSAKVELIVRSTAAGVRIISSMGAGNKLDPTRFEVSDVYKTSVCPLARVMRTELKKRGVKKLKVVYSKEEPIKRTVDGNGRHAPGSIAFVPSVVGLIIAAEVIKDIAAEAAGENT